MAQTVSRRPSPLRESTYPSPSSPTTSTTTNPPSSSASRSQTIDLPVSRPRPKSIIDRILRNSTYDSSENIQTADQNGQPSKPSRLRSGKSPADPTSNKEKSEQNRNGTIDKWDNKRASRKAPPPPVKRHSTLAGQSIEEKYIDGMIHGEMPELSRQPRPISAYHTREGQEVGGIGMPDSMDSERGFEMVGVVPKVFLHPPEEEETEPIKLYPLPPPPSIARPPLIHFPASSSRPSSLFSVDSSMSSDAKNTWGGMASKFGKPPPPFKRGSTAARAGIVMPKRREEVQRDQKRRMSMYNPEDMDWQAGSSTQGPMSPPRRRASSPPAIASPPIRARPSTPPPEGVIIPRPPIPYRAVTAPAMGSRPRSPPRIMVTSESSASIASLTTETAHSTETTETGFYSFNSHSPPDDAVVLDEPTPFGSIPSSPVVESPISFTPPQLPEPLPSMEDMSNAAETALVSPRSVPLPLVEEEDEPSSVSTTIQDDFVNDDVAPEVSTIPSVSAPPTVVRSNTDPADVLALSTARIGPAGNRRSMSLTSLLLPKSTDAVPPVPPVPGSGSNGKTIRKQKSLKRFFFSSSDLASEEREPVPKLDKDAIKAKAEKSKKSLPSKQDIDQTAVVDEISAESSEKMERRGSHDKRDGAKGRSTFGGMLSRPKSKPSLRIDVKASREPVPPAPASAPSITSVPASTPLTSVSTATSLGSEVYPETPSSRTSTKGKAKATPIQVDGAGVSRCLTKRFSLSNMSSAFKRSKRDISSHAPQVPDLPVAFKKDKQGRSFSEGAQSGVKETRSLIKESAVPLSPKLAQSAIIDSPRSRNRPLLSPPVSPSGASFSQAGEESRPCSPRLGSPKSISETLPPPSPKETASIISDASSTYELDQELTHAQLMSVSPRTRRNPAESLQDILGVAPISRQSRIVKLEPAFSRRSVEAIVLGPLLLSPSTMETIPDIEIDRRDSEESSLGLEEPSRPIHYDSEASLETLSRSSSTSDPLDHTAPVTPVSDPCAMPLASAPPLPPLPPLLSMPSDMITVDAPSMEDIYISPTSTVTTSRRSPEAIFRILSGGGRDSPKSIASSRRGSTEIPISKALAMDFTISPPPLPAKQEGEEGYRSLEKGTQLRSLHFDTLGLDFDGYAFPPSLMPAKESA